MYHRFNYWEEAMSYDLVIKNGIVVDGTGRPRYQADVAIARGKVAAIGKVTEGARRADGSVRTLSGEIYNPSRGDEGAVEVGDIEAHLTFHDDVFPMTTSVPPMFSFFYHLVFEDVRIEIVQADGP